MKKIFTLILSAISILGFAQTNITFKVDMNNYGGSTAPGVFVNGNFTTNGGEWCGSCNPMTDADNDGIWETTIAIAKDTIEYKFTVDGWNAQENFMGGEPCTITTNGFTNRYLTRTGDVVLDVVCYNACTTCSAVSTDSVDITFRVNTASLTEIHPSGIFIAGGGIFGNPGDNPLTDANSDGVWETTIRKPKGISGNYIFLNGSASSWDAKEQLAGKPCGDPNNFNDRTLATITQDTTIQACYGECTTDGSCPTAVVIAEPMAAAADPTAAEEDVISIFSGVYSNVLVTTWRTDWSNATLEDIQVDGNDVKKYSMLDFVGIETTGENSIDVSSMQYFTFDAWTPNATTYRIKLVDFGPNNAFDQDGDDTEHEIVFEMPATETWTNHKISLEDFTGLTTKENISQIIFSALPTSEAILYLDNIYFSKDATSSTQEQVFGRFDIYPNPATGIINLNIQTKSGSIVDYKLQDISGKAIISKDVNSSVLNDKLDIAGLQAGIYFIQINSTNGSSTQKIIVQ